MHRSRCYALPLAALVLVGCDNPVQPPRTTGQIATGSLLRRSAGVAQRYAVRDLGTLGGDFSLACCINERGQVTGQSTVSPGPAGFLRMFLWTEEHGMRSLGTLGGNNSQGNDINDRGDVAGWSEFKAGSPLQHASLWTHERGMLDLGTLGGPQSNANGINRGRVEEVSASDDRPPVIVVGASDTRSGAFHAFIWTAGGGMRDLGTLGGMNSEALGVNDAGQVVGDAQVASGDSHAFIWTQAHGMHDLGTLPGFTQFFAGNITEHGEVVGAAFSAAQFPFVAFTWTEEDGMRSLGTLGGLGAIAFDINESGQIVGGGALEMDADFAWVWTKGHGIHLPTLDGEAQNLAFGINDAGTIVGQNLTLGGQLHAVQWTRQEEALTAATPAVSAARHGGPVTATRPGVASPAVLCALERRFERARPLGHNVIRGCLSR